MSRTDKLDRNRKRETNAWIVNGVPVSAKIRNALLPTAREAIDEQVADMLMLDLPVMLPRTHRRYVEPYRGLQTDFVTQPYTLGNYREVRLSNCEFGCKVYSDGTTERIEHSRTYGCRKATEPIVKPVIQRVQPKRQRITERVRPGKPNRSANLDVDTPSLMHMAKARAKALGL